MIDAEPGAKNVAFVTPGAPTASEFPRFANKSAYPFLVWKPVRLAVACAGIVAMLAMSGCTGSKSDSEVLPSQSEGATQAPTAQGEVDPTIPIPPSLPAGIPTADATPRVTPNPTSLDASVMITIATVDPDTGGLLVGGYVSGVVEDGGDCQYVITPESGKSMTIHKDGVENNGSTSCGSTTVANDLVPPGSYTVVLRYANDVGQVASGAVEVQIP